MSTDYGTDISTYPDLDATFGLISGPRVVAECVARRVEVLLHGALNADLNARELRVVQASVHSLATQDERVQDAEVTASLLAGGLFQVKIKLSLVEDETFDLTLRISDVTVETIFGVQ